MSKKAYAIAVAALLGATPIAFAAQPVIVDVGTFLGMGGKRVPVKLSDFRTDNNRLTLDVTKEQLQQVADYWIRDRNTGSGSSTSPVHGGKIGSGR